MTVSNPNSSGTVGQTTITVQNLIDIATRRTGKPAESLTPEQVNSLRYGLFYILSNISNRGINLWTTYTYRLGVKEGELRYMLPQGTVGVLNANYSQLVNRWQVYDNSGNPLAWCDSNSSTYFTSNTISLPFQGAPETIGIELGPTASGVLANKYVLEYQSPVDSTWTIVYTSSTFNQNGTQDGTWIYSDLDGLPTEVNSLPIVNWRVRGVAATGATGEFNVRELVIGQNLQEIPMAPLNRDDYFNLPNKTFQSARPLQYFFQKNITPELFLWPVPNDPSYSINLFLEQHIQDVGSLQGELYLPQRWLPYVQAALAHTASMELPGVEVDRIQYLEGQADKLMRDAEDGEEDGLPIYWAPNISYYTA